MTQLDPHLPTGAPVPPDDNRPGSPRPEPGFNWRVTVGMLVGLVVLFGVLFGLRALQIFPAEPGQDAVIAAARATQAALGTQEALAPRPTVGVAGAPAEAQTARPTAAPTISVAKPAAAATASLAQQPATGQQPAPAVPPAVQTAAPMGVATTQPVIGATVAPTPAPSTAPTGRPNPTDVQAEATPVQAAVPSDLAAAIVQGYSNYWSVRVSAMRDPSDTTIHLESVMAGDELQSAYKTLAQYREAGAAFDTTVRHQIWITNATNEQAIVVDRYSGSTVQLDPITADPVGSEPIVQNFSDKFVLQNIDGVWKVVGESPEGS